MWRSKSHIKIEDAPQIFVHCMQEDDYLWQKNFRTSQKIEQTSNNREVKVKYLHGYNYIKCACIVFTSRELDFVQDNGDMIHYKLEGFVVINNRIVCKKNLVCRFIMVILQSVDIVCFKFSVVAMSTLNSYTFFRYNVCNLWCWFISLWRFDCNPSWC